MLAYNLRLNRCNRNNDGNKIIIIIINSNNIFFSCSHIFIINRDSRKNTSGTKQLICCKYLSNTVYLLILISAII